MKVYLALVLLFIAPCLIRCSGDKTTLTELHPPHSNCASDLCEGKSAGEYFEHPMLYYVLVQCAGNCVVDKCYQCESEDFGKYKPIKNDGEVSCVKAPEHDE
eukprot:TCONS_00013352-protein